MKLFSFVSLVMLLVVMSATVAFAQVRSSSNYSIERDSINTGGGLSGSSNYGLESTLGEAGTGDSNSSNYVLRAGYQQVDDAYLALSNPADVVLSPAIGGVTGGTSNGSTFVVATTDSLSGYQLLISASTAPAMQSGANTIADYVPVGATPDAVFTTNANESHLAYSVQGSDVVGDFLLNGGACGSGTNTPGSCWDGLSVSNRAIAEGAANYPFGATTTLDFLSLIHI